MNTPSLKRRNLFNVIRTVKLNKAATKPEIALHTGLTTASIHNFVNELLEKGLLIEEGQNASNGGRKASLYRFNSVYRHIIGVYIALHSITCSVIDLDFNEKVHLICPIDLANDDVQSSLGKVMEQIRIAIERSGLALSDFVGIGVTVPGAVSREKGIILNLVNAPGWRNIPLKSMIEGEIGLPVIIDKDNCGIVLHYKWAALRSEKANVIHISVTDGIGAGILINGSLYRGNHHVAGEIGHMTVDPNGEPCNCGSRGCLELFAGSAGIVKGAIKQIAAGEESSLADILGERGAIEIGDVILAAKENDALACKLFATAADYLVMATGNIMKLYDPDEIIFDCQWLAELPGMFDAVVGRIFENTRIVARSDVAISMNSIEGLLIKGAATLQYEELFGSADTCTLI